MPSPTRALSVYLHLARASSARRRPLARDKLLVLAAAAAADTGLADVADQCRRRVLEHNRQHLVGHWPTLADALAAPRFQTYLKQLRRRYSPERAEQMLVSLGIELGSERALYESEDEYARALLAAIPRESAERGADAADAVESTATEDGGQPATLWLWAALVAAIGAALAALIWRSLS